MRKSLLNRFITVSILIIISYSSIFFILHFVTPDIGHVQITVTPTEDNPEVCYVTLTIENPFDEYYILIYENSKTDNWMYSTSSTYGSASSKILDEFLPEDKSKYVLLSGNTHKNTFTFTLKSKYPISYMSSLEHLFHVYYVVPVNIFPFEFYFNKHYVFFVDPLI